MAPNVVLVGGESACLSGRFDAGPRLPFYLCKARVASGGRSIRLDSLSSDSRIVFNSSSWDVPTGASSLEYMLLNRTFLRNRVTSLTVLNSSPGIAGENVRPFCKRERWLGSRTNEDKLMTFNASLGGSIVSSPALCFSFVWEVLVLGCFFLRFLLRLLLGLLSPPLKN